MENTEVAWAAGLFEGEGTIYAKDSRVRVAIQMTDLDILERVQAIFGGTIVETKVAKEHYKRCWKWTISGSAKAKEFLKLIYPYLGNRRREKAEVALAVLSPQEKKKILAEKVQTLRAAGNTHQAIADKLGFDRSYITHILRKFK